jgi:hypothetical protein
VKIGPILVTTVRSCKACGERKDSRRQARNKMCAKLLDENLKMKVLLREYGLLR